MEFKFRNVNDAFTGLVKVFVGGAQDVAGTYGFPVVRRSSRNGDVLVIDEPVLITYDRPRERVLFNPARDANPFALLYEALWMLAGRNDVAPLAYYTKQFTQYSDDGKVLNGAYGYRWRHAVDQNCIHCSQSVDQLDVLVAHLKADPNSRRAVLSMWNVEDDLLKIGCGCTCQVKHSGGPHDRGCNAYLGSKDVCCNLSVMFSIREHLPPDDPDGQSLSQPRRLLDITVTNRSNDMVWGLLGANYVTFSFLQEYLAARLGVEVGRYRHFTNNLHVYTGTSVGKTAAWKPEEWLAADRTEYHEPASGYNTVPLVNDPAVFETELPMFVEEYGGATEWREVKIGDFGPDLARPAARYTEPFLRGVAAPMLLAYRAHKFLKSQGVDCYGAGAYRSLCLANIADDAWRIAATEWVQRRLDRKKEGERV